MEKTFLLYLSVHWGDLIEQIIKKSVIYTLKLSNSAPARIPAAAMMKGRQNTAKAILEFFFAFSKLIVLTAAKRQLSHFSNRDFFPPVKGKTTKLIVALSAMKNTRNSSLERDRYHCQRSMQ